MKCFAPAKTLIILPEPQHLITTVLNNCYFIFSNKLSLHKSNN